MGWRDWPRMFRRRSDDDFAAELESHLAFEVDRLVQGGMSPVDAERAARRAFGNVTSSQEQFRRSRPWHALESLGQDVRYALRTMRRDPSFTVIAVLSLAIGIGVNTTMFGVVDALLVRTPAHVRDAERVHRLVFEFAGRDGVSTSWSAREGYGTYSAIRDRVAGFEELGAYEARSISSGRGADARSLSAVLATPSVFRLLGVQPARGRFFDDVEELDAGDHVAVLGYQLWREQYGGDEAVLGKQIDISGLPHIIVGVAPEGFTGIDIDQVDLWLPIGVANRIDGYPIVGPTAGSFWLQMVGKRRVTTDPVALANEVTLAYRAYWRANDRGDDMGRARALLGPVVAARGPVPDRDARISVWVAAVSLIVLLIAAANVANLLLLRGLQRSREFALRLSLGASRVRLLTQSLVEGLLLSAAGAVGAIVLASWSATAMRRFFLPKAESASVFEPRLLAFTAIIALGTGLLAALVPALVTARRDFGPLLGAARATMSKSRLAVQRTLIGVQVTLATLLLVGAGLFVTSLRNVQDVDLGIDVDHVLYVRLELEGSSVVGAEARRIEAQAIHQRVLERVRQLPGVASATVSAGEPLASGFGIYVARQGDPPPAAGTSMPVGRAVGPDYFATIGTRLVRGRSFTAADHRAGARVAIIDEAAAARVWGDGDPLDRCAFVDFEKGCTEIVGVVANTVLWEIIGQRADVVYVPLETRDDPTPKMMEVRTTGDPFTMIAPLRETIAAASPGLPWVSITPLAERIAPQLRPWRLAASMLTAFGALALLLAAVGLYGILSYIVARRTQEIGIRRALGATDSGVVAMIVRGGLWMTLPGIVIGIGVALAAGKLLASELYGVAPHDSKTIAISAVSLVVVALIACLAPARRATRVDPMVTLKAE